jgi:SAM-dependent methyltransferase
VSSSDTLRSAYDEAYFVGGTKSNYGDYADAEEAIDVGFMPVIRRYADRAGRGLQARSSLDIGCAYGFYVERLAKLGWRATGIDVSSYAIERGRARGLRDLHVGPAQELPFPDDTFDFVMSIDVIEHIPPEDARRAVAEARRVLKPGGMAVFATPNFLSNRHWNVHTPGFEDPDITHINYQSALSLQALFEGFSRCDIRGHTPFLEQFHGFDALFRSPLLRFRLLRGAGRRAAWKLLGRRIAFSSYLHAIAIK